MAVARDKLDPRSGGSALGHESHQQKTPTVTRGRGFLFLRSGS